MDCLLCRIPTGRWSERSPDGPRSGRRLLWGHPVVPRLDKFHAYWCRILPSSACLFLFLLLAAVECGLRIFHSNSFGFAYSAAIVGLCTGLTGDCVEHLRSGFS